MPEVRRRTTATKSTTTPVSRRRDRARTDDEEDEDTDATTARRPARRSTSTRRTAAKRRPAPKDEDDEEEETDEEEEDEEEEGDERPARRSTARRSTSTKSRVRRTSRNRDDDDDDSEEDEEDDEAPPRVRSSRRTSSSRRSSSKSSSKLPPGLTRGRAGAEEMRRMGGGGENRLSPTNEPQLIKFLEPEPFVNYRVHWIEGGGSANRPYTCLGRGCPLCKLADRASAVTCYNVLLLSVDDEEPVNRFLPLGVRADKALETAATDRKGKLDIEKDFFTIMRSGKGQRSQTNFHPIKERDLEEDWEEVLEKFDIEELEAIIDDARANIFDYTIVQVSSKTELSKIAKHLTQDDDDDDDDD